MMTRLPFHDWRSRHPWLTGVLVAATGTLAVIGGLRVWVTTDSGRDFIASRINGMDVAGYGQLNISGLRGDPLSELTISRLNVRNDDGIWIEAEDVRLNWSPLSLLTRTLQINEIDAGKLSVLSRPVREDRPPSEGGRNLRIHLNSLVLDRLILADGVAGPESISEISARFVQQSSGALDAALRLRPIEGRGDRVDLLIVMTASRRFDITVIADAPAGGFFSHLLNLEPGSAARLEANGAGDLRNGVGEARFSIDRDDKVYLSAKMEDGKLNAAVTMDATTLPLPQRVQSFLGPAAEAALAAQFDGDEAAFEFDSFVAEGELHLAGQADLARRELIGPARLRADLASLQPFWTRGAGIRLDGEFGYSAGQLSYAGDARLIAEEDSVLPFEAAAGLVAAAMADGAISFSGDLELLGPFPFGEPTTSAIGAAPAVNLQGRYEMAEGRLFVDGADLRHQSGSLRLAGDIAVPERRLTLAGRVNQSIAPFVTGFRGSAEGIVSLDGTFDDIALTTNLTLRNLSGPDALSPLLGTSGQAAATLRIAGGDVTARAIRLRLPGLSAEAAGTLAGGAGLDLSVTGEQLAELEFGGTQVQLGAIDARLTRPGDTLLIAGTSSSGWLANGSNRLEQLAVTTSLLQSGDAVAGPVRLTGRYNGERVNISALLDRRDATTRIDDLAGFVGQLRVAGRGSLADAGGFSGAGVLTGRDFEFSNTSFGQFSVDASVSQLADEPVIVVLDADLRNTVLPDGTRFDRARTNIRTVRDGYEYSAHLEDATRGRATDMRVSGSASLAGEAPQGTLRLAGSVFGQTISTRRDAIWRLGASPEIDADISLLGGSLQAILSNAGTTPELRFSISDVDAAPILTNFRVPVSAARINGSGSFRPYGRDPSGNFEIRTSSPVTGLDGALELDINGRLGARIFALDGSARYGPALGGDFSLALPVVAEAEKFARIDQEGSLLGQANLKGSLEAIRQISLAYGHDIGGEIDASFRIAGTPAEPRIDGRADIRNGIYEYGAMGFRIARFDANATLRDGDVTVNATGQGPDGGNLKAAGRLESAGDGQVDIEVRRLLVYDRNRDRMRVTGNAALKETSEARVISGALTIDEAHFSLDNLPAAGVRRLDVRWREDLTDEPGDPVLEKPIRFDFGINSDRRIMIDGRGLTSEWGVNVHVTGSPAAPLLNGRANLVRGELELARRPFVFDSGTVTFDGPIDTARVAIRADRQVDGFRARVDVTGAPGRPRIELSSTPDLPQDEILSRMLFGRSAMDLSPLEAAELATSIARLSGQGGGIDPLGQLQAGLGLDRLRLGLSEEGTTELGVGQYLAPDVYLEVTTAGAAGNSVEVEWQPRPQVSVTSEARSTGESRVSVRWKRDY
ncbi:MAG: translocation/assembly module TamB domain-containing protein [Hyphomonas sp.]